MLIIIFNIFKTLLAVSACGCVVAMFTPQFLMILKTKNTVALNLFMFLLHTLVGFFYTISFIFFFAASGSLGAVEVATKIMFMVLNIYVFVLSCYMIFIKLKNSNEAKKLNITELDHYLTKIQK